MTWTFLALVGVLLFVSNLLTGALFWHAGRKAGQLHEREMLSKSLSSAAREYARERNKVEPLRRKRNDD